MVGERELAFDDSFQKLVVRTIEIVKNPRVEEL